jgi:hypothetical protein
VPGGRPLTAVGDVQNLLPYRVQPDPVRGQGRGRQPFGIVQQTKQEVLGTYVVVAELAGFLLSCHDGPPGPAG